LVNRELKNSEDVQDALIEDYFRYNDLSRMEADDILMNISEIEIPNYEYVELDLLNLPRDLSTNLNEDSDNQKENVDIFRVFQLSVWSASLHFQLQQTTDISRDLSLRLSKRLADSDLAVIGRTGIGPIRKISA
jgi:hypothetical protein